MSIQSSRRLGKGLGEVLGFGGSERSDRFETSEGAAATELLLATLLVPVGELVEGAATGRTSKFVA